MDEKLTWVHQHGFLHLKFEDWELWVVRDSDGDVRKMSYFAIHGSTVKDVDWTPYTRPSIADFARAIALDFPHRQGGSPWRSDTLEAHWIATVTRAVGPL